MFQKHNFSVALEELKKGRTVKLKGKSYKLQKDSFGSCNPEDEKVMLGLLNEENKVISYEVLSWEQILSNDWEVL